MNRVIKRFTYFSLTQATIAEWEAIIQSAGNQQNGTLCLRDQGDMKRFIELWKTHYSDMIEEDKSLLPIREIVSLPPSN
jgi:hypothetical protein